MKLSAFLFFSFLILFSSLNASSYSYCKNHVYIGPESYQMYRTRDGGTCQNGMINGVCVGFDHIKRYSWYVGLEYLYAKGTLNGHSGSGNALHSQLTDSIFEMRVGYNFQKKELRSPFIIPFGGWGYFHEVNDFELPSPLPIKFTDVFDYVVIGFLSGVNFTPLLSMGINFKMRCMLNGKSHITEDPFMDDLTLTMENEIQLRLDFPIRFSPCGTLFGVDFYCAPFYEFRHFGGRDDFPFDYVDTKFQIYGIQGAIDYNF